MRLLCLHILLVLSSVLIGQEVVFSHASGIYENSFDLEIQSEKTIRYTLNGTPKSQRKTYSKPIQILKSTFVQVYVEDTVIARAFVIGFDTKLPVLQLRIDEEDLWNDTTGIYTKGKYAYVDSTGHWKNANYQKKWEREISMIYLDSNHQEVINQHCGVKIFGESTRRQPDKSMKLIARKEYGENRFEYPFFEERTATKYKQVVIRTSGNDYRGTRFKDVLNAYLSRNLGFDHMAYQPVQMFVNGKYWGVYNLREKVNEHFLHDIYGLHRDSVNIVMGRWVRQHGSAKDYMRMYNWFVELDTMDNRAYEKAKTMIDIRNYVNYRAYQVFINNSDSRGNVRYWNSNESSQDGKFRMIMYDTDLGFGNASRKYLENCLSPNRTEWYNPEWSTVYFRKLMQHEDFKNEFINQLAHLMNTSLHRDTIIAAVDHFEAIYKDELPRNSKELADHLKKVPIPMETWLENVDELRMFAKLRYKRLRPEITRLLAPNGEFTLVVDGEQGKVEVNENYGQILPFTGVYYRGVPLPIKAIDYKNWQFQSWSDGDTNRMKMIMVKEDSLVLKANYQYIEPVVQDEEKVQEPDISEETEQVDKSDGLLLWIGYALLGLGVVLLIFYFIIRKK